MTARLASDYVAEQVPLLPVGGRWDGPEGFAAMGSAILHAFLGVSIEPIVFRACGSAVLVDTQVRAPTAQHRPAPDQSMPPNGECRNARAVACRRFYADPE